MEQPTLGLAGTPGVSTCTDDIDPATLARLKGNRGVSVYGGNALLGWEEIGLLREWLQLGTVA